MSKIVSRDNSGRKKSYFFGVFYLGLIALITNIIFGGSMCFAASQLKGSITPEQFRAFLNSCETGDILLSLGSSSSGSALPIPGYFQHAGMFDKRRYLRGEAYPILSASNETDHGFKVGYESIEKWCKDVHVVRLRVKGWTKEKGEAAVDYASQFLGRDFNFICWAFPPIPVSREDNRLWYCSKLVYRGWLSQGINIEPPPGFGDAYVSPQDIYDDNDTYEIPDLAPVKINFQPADVPVSAGYIADCGETYGSRNGQTYGWNTSHSDTVRDRDINEDQKVDTILQVHAGGFWEMEVENGCYDVTVSIGDPGFSSINTVNVEGSSYWNNECLEANNFLLKKNNVRVLDGRLTIDNGISGEKQTRINCIGILRTAPLAAPAPDLSITRINFQSSNSLVPTGFLPDYGDVYGPRNGKTYGWQSSHTDVMRERNLNTEQKLDTLAHMHSDGVWEIEVPNGEYDVIVCIGDAGFDCTNTINVENINYWNQEPLKANNFLQKKVRVTVNDGRITIDNGASEEKQTRINYIEISK